MFCDGACLGNGLLSSPASANPESDAITEVPLESNGVRHTSSRAELHSAIVGLGLRCWRGEGPGWVVVVMDSVYVVLGVSERIQSRLVENSGG